MAKTGSKKRKITIYIVSIVAVIALLFGACAVYLGDYYHAITPAGESFGLRDGSSLPETIKLDNGNIVCKSEKCDKGTDILSRRKSRIHCISAAHGVARPKGHTLRARQDAV